MPVPNLLYLDIKHTSIHTYCQALEGKQQRPFTSFQSLGAKTMPDTYCKKYGGFPGVRTFTLSRRQKICAFIKDCPSIPAFTGSTWDCKFQLKQTKPLTFFITEEIQWEIVTGSHSLFFKILWYKYKYRRPEFTYCLKDWAHHRSCTWFSKQALNWHSPMKLSDTWLINISANHTLHMKIFVQSAHRRILSAKEPKMSMFTLS